uniref:protein phosphatase 2C 37-like n=1 Tax=Erigeron canadensis TaxID=72917 RepID=UPI001CB967AC|nr:protein phosphatase 2C 37-like [Erigeron canadensis]
MAGMCCEIVGETEAPSHVESSGARRRRLEIHQLKLLAAPAADTLAADSGIIKRRKLEKGVETKAYDDVLISRELQKEILNTCDKSLSEAAAPAVENSSDQNESRFGVTTVCGRRRDMEDAVAVKPLFYDDMHFYGVFDGHGCSHVAMKCKDRMHEIVKSELEGSQEWKETMAKSFSKMDKEVSKWDEGDPKSNCRCELQTPQCDTVGSTAVVAVVAPDKIVVSNCGDSRAVLCRNGTAIPLTSDHKPDRPDELARIEEAGGRVIYWDGARVLGVLAMSRAIGDNYLKPYVIPEPEVTVTERTSEDECLILASDGLWDVVSNDVACGVARMCLNSQNPPSPIRSPSGSENVAGGESSDKACLDASILLTKLALARRSSDNVSVVVVDLRKNL